MDKLAGWHHKELLVELTGGIWFGTPPSPTTQMYCKLFEWAEKVFGFNCDLS